MTHSGSPPAGQVYGDLSGPVVAELISKEAERAEAALSSVQSRGMAVISSSGTLVTLLFGLSALATKAQNFALPGHTKLPLCLSAVFLVLAASLGIATNLPLAGEAIALKELRPLLDDKNWNAPAFHAEQEVARTRLAVVEDRRRRNTRTAWLLVAAIATEIGGIGCVMWSVLSLIFAT